MQNYSALTTNPQSFCEGLQVKSIADNFLSASATIGSLARMDDIGELRVKALLNILVTDAVLFFEVGKSMGGVQVTQTVQLIWEDYQHFKPEDFKLCFNNAKKGHYGKLYDRLDGQIILQWLMDYDNERDGEIEAYRAKENRELKAQPGIVQQLVAAGKTDELEKPDIFRENISKLLGQLERSKAERDAVKRQQIERIKDPQRDMHNWWLMQFDKLRQKQVDRTGMVRKYGLIKNPFYCPGGSEPMFTARKLNVNDFLEHKHWQHWLAGLPKDERMKQYLTKYPKK